MPEIFYRRLKPKNKQTLTPLKLFLLPCLFLVWMHLCCRCRRYCCRPVRSEKSKRRTRALASTLEPRWNQTFLYSHLRRSELRSRFLEITVWDSDRLDTGRLIGEVRGRVCVCAGIHFFFVFIFFLSFGR